MSSLLSRIRALRAEDGYVMVTVMGVLLIATLFSVAALAAADKDAPQSRQDVDRKGALGAAEAGLGYYQYHLNEDNNWWAACTNVEGPSSTQQAPVNQAWNGSGSDPRVWRDVPGSTDQQYTIELLPAPGKTACDPANPAQSMIDPATGTFRIRATGRSSANRQGDYVYRSVVASFRRRGFLDFLYFTDFETSPPSVYARYGSAAQAWAASSCAKYWRDGRGSESFDTGSTTLTCTAIQFAGGDAIKGPMHTNDSILICGNPTFGRTTDSNGNAVMDKIEVSDPNAPGYRNSCAGTPNIVPSGNSLKIKSPLLTLPPSNTSLTSVVKPEYTFTGTTTIRLSGSSMTVTDYSGAGGTVNGPRSMPFPDNGVVYVKNGSCGSSSYNSTDPYNVPNGCAIAYVSGTYSKSLTLASERDVVVRPLPSDADNTGLVRQSGSDAIMGLIGNDHVRVYHEVKNRSSGGFSCDEDFTTGSKQNFRIDAAILALNYSFMVDNYYCGDPLGNLTVNGVIAQRFRGAVGTGGSSGNATGYIKRYGYDDRLVYRSPPYFLDPVQSAWQVVRYSEQAPAAK